MPSVDTGIPHGPYFLCNTCLYTARLTLAQVLYRSLKLLSEQFQGRAAMKRSLLKGRNLQQESAEVV